jgi:hypothetical protein
MEQGFIKKTKLVYVYVARVDTTWEIESFYDTHPVRLSRAAAEPRWEMTRSPSTKSHSQQTPPHKGDNENYRSQNFYFRIK